MNRIRCISSYTLSQRFVTCRSIRTMPLRKASVHYITVPEKLEIHLTEVENKICTLLHDCSEFLREKKRISTTCRIAGGWVRDKLLGHQTNDMDVALSNIMGLAFAEHLRDFAHSKGVELGHITKIEQNPEQSKHLETATMKMFGMDIDLVNLRSEEYAVGSRIPTDVAFGTPLEDALRRDITINALFYNVDSRVVEDFTEKGLHDLHHGIIRTPMPPLETFLDDPLRVLRCVRFASRFGFELVPELKDAVKGRIVQEALISKVARERVGDEVGKMITGPAPLHSAQIIHELSLYHSIFSVVPPEVKESLSDQFLEQNPADALGAASILNALLSPSQFPELIPHSYLLSVVTVDSSCKARLFLAALLVPYMDLTYKDKKKKSNAVTTSVIRDSLKLGTQHHFLDGIPVLFSALPLIKEHLKEHSDHPMTRVKLGLLLRDKLVHNMNTGNHWTTSLLFALVTDLEPFYDILKDSLDIDAASKVISSYNLLVDTIIHLGLQDDVESKPLLNGRDIRAAFGVAKAGPWIGKVLEDVIEWQLAHPSGTPDDCLQWLKGKDASSYIDSDESSEVPTKRLRTK
ncbi:hypothetical protein CPB84DRAFT_1759891 [Gymnopilus junonius]|uniref:tRNA nucleotidyltransferase n=1 Tax=Gymnopilus junonius TaxID=109634 RepID=A0A9P5TTN3_GYMJU|nr:hypothetical protein CPB84DRAFT_1759891 [Gymnopilus junonius]